MNILEAQIDGPLGVARVLAALYNASQPLGMGRLQFDPAPMAPEQAQALLDAGQTDFDYLKGRVMKLDLSSSPVFYPDGTTWLEISPWGYDRDNGEGAVQSALEKAGIRTRAPQSALGKKLGA